MGDLKTKQILETELYHYSHSSIEIENIASCPEYREIVKDLNNQLIDGRRTDANDINWIIKLRLLD